MLPPLAIETASLANSSSFGASMIARRHNRTARTMECLTCYYIAKSHSVPLSCSCPPDVFAHETRSLGLAQCADLSGRRAKTGSCLTRVGHLIARLRAPRNNSELAGAQDNPTGLWSNLGSGTDRLLVADSAS